MLPAGGKSAVPPFQLYDYSDVLRSARDIPGAWQYCTQQLSIPHKDRQTDDSLIEKIKDYVAHTIP